MKNKFIKCACSSELISLEYWPDDKQVYLSIWQRGWGNNNKLTLFERLRWCWQILRKGCPYGDQIILQREEIRELVEHLSEIEFECKIEEINDYLDSQKGK